MKIPLGRYKTTWILLGSKATCAGLVANKHRNLSLNETQGSLKKDSQHNYSSFIVEKEVQLYLWERKNRNLP